MKEIKKIKEKSLKRFLKLAACITLVTVLTALIALLGFHLTSRYKETITGFFDSISEKISDSESDIIERAESAAGQSFVSQPTE